MSLRRKIVVFFVLVITLLAGVCLPTIYWISGEHLRSLLFENYSQRIDQEMVRIHQFFNERSSDILLEAGRVSNLSPSERPEIQKRLLEFKGVYPIYKELSVFLPSGEKIIGTSPLDLGQTSRSTFLTRTLGSESGILDYEQSGEGIQTDFIFAKAIVDQGKVVGVLAGYVDADVLFREIGEGFKDPQANGGRDFKLIQTRWMSVLFENSSGAISFDPSRLSQVSSQVQKPLRDVHVFVEDQFDSFVFVGQHRELDSSSIGDWQMLVKVKKSDIYAPINMIVVLLGLMFVILLISVLWGFYWLYSQLFSPLVDLSDRIRRFGQGEYDVFHQVDKRNDEISMMAKNLDHMSGDLRKSMTELSQQSRLSAIGQMAGGIAHEVNNPLAIIIMRADILSQLIARGTVDPKEIKLGLEKITETAVRISKIIKGLRALAREGEHEAFSEVYVKSVITSTFELCEQSVKNKEIILRLEQAPSDPRFECRPVQVSQVLLNLINNAVDEIKNLPFEERWVEIRVKDLGDQVLLQVLNGGPKISEEVASKMFQPFFTTKGAGEGTGLGLSISKQIMGVHSGQIQVDLSEPNTCIVLTFPKVQPGGTGSADTPGSTAA